MLEEKYLNFQQKLSVSPDFLKQRDRIHNEIIKKVNKSIEYLRNTKLTTSTADISCVDAGDFFYGTYLNSISNEIEFYVVVDDSTIKYGERREEKKDFFNKQISNIKTDTFYSVLDFARDLSKCLKQLFELECNIIQINNRISLRFQIGITSVTCVLTIAVYDENKIKYFNTMLNDWKFDQPDIVKEKLNEKNKVSDNSFFTVVKFFKYVKSLSKQFSLVTSNMIEGVLFNVPSELFKGAVEDALYKTVNFIKASDLSNFKNIFDDKKLFLNKIEESIFTSFLSYLIYIILEV